MIKSLRAALVATVIVATSGAFVAAPVLAGGYSPPTSTGSPV